WWKTKSASYWICGTLSTTARPLSRSRARKIVAIPLRAMTSSTWYWSSTCPGWTSAIRADGIELSTQAPPRAGRRGGRTVDDGGDLHAQVVLASPRAAAFDDRSTGRFRLVDEEADDLILAQIDVHAVAALQQHVARENLEREDVDADDELAAEATRQHV